ncbi:hypothetical protein [Luteibacter sp.]|uniref:hypothetical protein n=1 Tax=Luteibacter sp. TaxID=1886636 RepID=UPI003F7FDC97
MNRRESLVSSRVLRGAFKGVATRAELHALGARLDGRIAETQIALATVAARTEERFNSIDERFDGIERRFDVIDKKFVEANDRSVRIEDTVNSTGRSVVRMEEQLLQRASKVALTKVIVTALSSVICFLCWMLQPVSVKALTAAAD